MNMLLFQVQQVFSPVVGMWPVWLLLVAIYAGFALLGWNFLAVWIRRFGIIVLTLFFLLRVLQLVIFPYQQTKITVNDASTLEQLPLYVLFRNGKLVVSHKDTQVAEYRALDVKNGYTFGKGKYKDLLEGEYVSIDSLYLRNEHEVSFLTKTWTEGELTVPNSFTNLEKYILMDAKGDFDLTNSVAPDVAFGLYFSDVAIHFPETKGDKHYEIGGGSRASAYLYLPIGPTYKFIDETNAVIAFPDQFKKTGYQTYEMTGSKDTTITVLTTVSMPRTLEVVLVNPHNE